jgi:type IV fimbrial biogenesis protein FimT
MGTFQKRQEITSGFTLIELIVTIGLFGILATIMVPAFFAWRPNYELRRAARDLYANMQLAKIEAIKTNQPITVTFSTVNQNYSFPFRGNVQTTTLSNYDNRIVFGFGAVNQDWDNINIAQAVTYAGSQVVFSPRGTCGSQGAVYLTNGNGRVYGISTLISGFIGIHFNDDGSNNWH